MSIDVSIKLHNTTFLDVWKRFKDVAFSLHQSQWSRQFLQMKRLLMPVFFFENPLIEPYPTNPDPVVLNSMHYYIFRALEVQKIFYVVILFNNKAVKKWIWKWITKICVPFMCIEMEFYKLSFTKHTQVIFSTYYFSKCLSDKHVWNNWDAIIVSWTHFSWSNPFLSPWLFLFVM